MLSLPGLLRVLPLDAQHKVLGDSFSNLAACRQACKDMHELCKHTVSHVDLCVSMEALAQLRQGPAAKSPSVLFPSATRLSLRLPGTSSASSQAATLLLRIIPPKVRRRITHVSILPASEDSALDYLQLMVTVGEHLPCLQSLYFVDSRDLLPSNKNSNNNSGRVKHSACRLLSIFGAVSTYMPGLQRLTLPQLSCPVALPWLGALATPGSPLSQHLRQLTLTTCSYTAPAHLTEAGLAALCGLTALEQLTLGCLELGGHLEGAPDRGEYYQQYQQGYPQAWGGGGSNEADDLWPLQLLLGARRPPRLRRLALEGGYFSLAPSAELLEVSYEPGLRLPRPSGLSGPEAGAVAGAGAGGGVATAAGSPGGGWGISHVRVQPPPCHPLLCLDAMAAVLLEATEALGQRRVPELAIPQLVVAVEEQQQVEDEEEQARVLGPQGALPQLVARCGRVLMDRLVVEQEPQGRQQQGQHQDQHQGQPSRQHDAVVAAVVRVLGLPRLLKLRHGEWACCVPEELMPPAAGEGAAPPATGQCQEPHAGRPRKRLRAALQDWEQPQQERLRQQGLEGEVGQARNKGELCLDTACPEEVLAAALDRLGCPESPSCCSPSGMLFRTGCTGGGSGGGTQAVVLHVPWRWRGSGIAGCVLKEAVLQVGGGGGGSGAARC